MTFQNDAIAVAETRSADLLRNFLIKRVIYALEDSENPEDFEALDSDTGAIPQAVSWSEAIWWLDASDTTTAHDGITTLVTSDGYRYKAAGVNVDIRSVLSDSVTAPPVSGLAIGDTYLVPAGATGAWSSHGDDIAIYTARGWQFVPPVIGYWLHVQDRDLFVRYDTAGAWVSGQGGRTFDANTVPVSAIINGGRTTFIVENQTTNTPPASPSVGVAYIIGGSPTGVWAGKAAQVAVCEATGEWTYYVPSNGYQAFDKSLSAAYRFNGSAWISASGSYVGRAPSVLTSGTGSTTAPSGDTVYTYSNSTAPTTSHRRLIDAAVQTYAAKRSGAALALRYSCDLTLGIVSSGGSTAAGDPVIALYRDSDTNAVDWKRMPLIKEITGADPFGSGTAPSTFNLSIEVSFEITSSDTSSHTYKVAIISYRRAVASFVEATAISRRKFALDEAA